MSNCPNLRDLDPNKPIYPKIIADEGDLERAMRHYGNWLKENKDKIILIDRFIIPERGYKVIAIYQLKDSKPEICSTYSF